MWHDPIVEEVRKVREEYAASHGYDLRRIFADLKRMEKEQGWKTVTLPPKRVQRIAKAS